MSEHNLNKTTTDQPAALQVPQAFVDYLKALALYPAGNPRVAANCTRVIETVREAIQAGESRPDYRFVFQGDDFVSDDVRVDCEVDPRLEWLRERFDRVALAGLSIRHEADEEALEVFANQFLDILRQRPKNPQFDDFWHDVILGIEPLERRYDGQHALDRETDQEKIAEWLLGGSDGGKLLSEMLRRSSRVARRISNIEDRLVQLAKERGTEGGAGEGVRVDVLDQVLKTLPLEALGDGPAIVKIVDQVLTKLEESIANSAIETGSLEIGKLLNSISRRFFTLTSDGQNPDSAAKGSENDTARERGHAGDEKVEDDTALLFEEMAELPPWEGTELGEDNEEQLGEIFAVYLAFLVRVEEQLALTRIRRLLRGLLSREEAIFGAVAANFLTWCESQAEEHGDWTAFDQFVDLAEEAGCPELLAELGQLELGSLVQRFPRTFFSFIDAIEPRRNSDDAQKLYQLFELLDPERIGQSAETIMAGISKHDRGEKIISVARERTLPFVHILLSADRERWMPLVAQFLSRFPTQIPETGLFKLLELDEIPNDWVALLLNALSDPTAANQKALCVRTAELLAELLDSTAYDPDMLDLRLWTIQLLGRLPCTGAVKALHRVLGRKKLFGLRKEDPAVREAAERGIASIEQALAVAGRASNRGGRRV